MEHRGDPIDLDVALQLQYEVGFDSDWACNDDTAMYQHMIPTAPYTQSFNPNISTLAGTEQSNESQNEKVRKPSLCHSLSRVF